MSNMKEAELHNKIKERLDFQRKICELLDIDFETCEFVSEDQFPNGIMVDFTLKSNGKVKALIELKGDDIGINDFVRGTGQVFQYQHFIDTKETIKNYIFDEAYTVYLFPSEIITKGKFNIGLMSYPSNCKIVEYNDETESFRLISEKQLNILKGEKRKQVATISQYYIRDTRLFELYIALKYIVLLKLLGNNFFDRKMMEEFLKQLDVPDKRNWRNAFISLSSLGLTSSENRPTEKGLLLGTHDFGFFVNDIYRNYIKPYVDILQKALEESNSDKTTVSLEDISKIISSDFGGQEVLFLTDSDNRYLSSWLNIMRDDCGCIDFEKNKTKKLFTTNYKMKDYNSAAIINKINRLSYPKSKIMEFMRLFKKEYLKENKIYEKINNL